MKWMLLIFVFGAAPFKTDLVFDNLDDCLKAEATMREEYARAYNEWLTWAQANKAEADYPDSDSSCRSGSAYRRAGLAFLTNDRAQRSTGAA